MKKFIFSLLVLLFMVCLLPFNVIAEEINDSNKENNDLDNNTSEEVLDSTIIKFDY